MDSIKSRKEPDKAQIMADNRKWNANVMEVKIAYFQGVNEQQREM